MPDIKDTLAERGARYGLFSDHAAIAQQLQDGMHAAPGWAKLAPDQKQALTVIADKIARMLNGDPDYVDNWHDIIGYATLVEDRLLGRGSYATLADAATDEGWIRWPGGLCPVAPHTIVQIRFRGGKLCKLWASSFDWQHHGGAGDVVTYRVIV